MIKLNNLTKSFGNNKVLNGINLEIEKGQLVVIIGQSGCGKSVLLKHIIGIIKPDSGDVLINGESISNADNKRMNKLRLKFGMVFQESALFDSLTIKENVGFSLIEHSDMSDSEIDTRVKDSLELVGLKGIEDKMPAQLSGGMKKRVALARAISFNPEIILYDEPTVGIDPVIADSINKLIKHLHNRLKTTSVVVTHDMESAYYIADKIAMLYRGKIINIGTPQEIKQSNNDVVNKFINGISEGFEYDINF